MVLAVSAVSFLVALLMVYMTERAAKTKTSDSVDMTSVWNVAAVGFGLAAVLSFCGWLWMTISGVPV